MTSNISTIQIEESVRALVTMAKEMTWNHISNNYSYILTEIKDSSENFHEQRKIQKRENGQKVPISIKDMLLIINTLYDNIYDLNFQIHKATKNDTIIEISYYPKSSLEPHFRQKVSDNPPMIHCKVVIPPWLLDKKKKFDINWEHREMLKQMRLLWHRIKFRITNR
jgi:hypothetical protein